LTRPVLEIDGARFDDLEGFWDEVSERLIPGSPWGRNLDAFNDVLRGGFGTPDGGFVLRWRNSARSRDALGPTLYDILLEIIRAHGPGGEEAEDGVVLELA
jgi:RNAse (barnase) inhibitor barstar